jgi:formylglycine-generating enzyme required for sulfatase activity
LIFDLARQAPPERVLQRLTENPQDSLERQGLILALGEYDETQLPAATRASFVPLLLESYRVDPDSGVHSAIDWLLRHDREGPSARRATWGQGAALSSIETDLTGNAPGGRRWYVNAEGQTMAIVAPGLFRMGSPQSERGRSAAEVPHDVRIPRVVAIATKEVTVEQFARFLASQPDFTRLWTAAARVRFGESLRFWQYTPTPDSPQVAVSWYDAARYCNWLSERDGIPLEQWVYSEDVRHGMQLPRDYLTRTGYRLPTEAEWEYAARAGTTTVRYFGTSEDLLTRFAWFDGNTGRSRTYPVGQLRPNQWGLFDVYGNVWEWVQDRRRPYPSTGLRVDDREDGVLAVTDDGLRVRRGGSFIYEAFVMRSAERGAEGYLPTQIRDNVGFRIARTVRND